MCYTFKKIHIIILNKKYEYRKYTLQLLYYCVNLFFLKKLMLRSRVKQNKIYAFYIYIYLSIYLIYFSIIMLYIINIIFNEI